jgi:ABC-type Fe3+/spermidine/putrescine transport system ATPase subunit
MGEVVLELRGVTKAFGTIPAVDSLSLEVHKGEVLTLLGPSGCGKTTTLRLVAGLEEPDDGEIYDRGKPIVSVRRGIFTPAYKRNMGMVFQSYALWPNMTVAENVAFPLELRRESSRTIQEKVCNTLKLVNLDHLEDRPVPLLSGGQQQRVALARALVYEPDLLLLDEPFSNLDAKLREQMRVELKLLQRKLGISVLFVTHDQIEALSLSDRVAVMNEGRVEQLGSPLQLYERPQTPFVRDFLGKTIVLRGIVDARENQWIRVRVEGTARQLSCCNDVSPGVTPGQKVYLAVRPEDVAPCIESRQEENSLRGVIETCLFVGDHYEVSLRLENGERILFYLPRGERWEEGRQISVAFPRERTSLWIA